MDGATITCLLRVLGGNPFGRLLRVVGRSSYVRLLRMISGVPYFRLLRVVNGNSMTHKLPVRLMFYNRRTAEEGRICDVLDEFEFEGRRPRNWFSDSPLSEWEGVTLHSGIVLIDCVDIS